MSNSNSGVYDFEIGDEFSDVNIMVQGKVFRAHKAILGDLRLR